MPTFCALQHDALVELFNMGVGQAASALADIVGEEVTMSVPTIRFLGRASACALLASAEGMNGAPARDGGKDGLPSAPARVCGVRQRYQSSMADGFHTEAIVMFAENTSLDIVRLMVGDGVPFEELTAMEQEAMGEIGNIVLNACVGTLANLLGQDLRGSLPVVQLASSAALLGAADNGALGPADPPADPAVDPAVDPIVMMLQIDLALEVHQIRGYIAFVLELGAMDGLRGMIDAYLARLTACDGA